MTVHTPGPPPARPAALAPAAARAPVAGLVLGALWACILPGAIMGLWPATVAGVIALGVYLALRLRHLPVEPIVHLCAAACLSGWALWQGQAALVGQGLARAGMVAALFVGLSVLRFAAAASPTVQASGALVAAQPPGRRYLAMTLGAHAVAVILNFGVVNLLGPMAAALRGPGAAALRESLGLAILRGFCITFMWSPLTLSFGVVTGALDGIRPGVLIGTGVLCAAVLLPAGWLLDRARRGGAGPAATPAAAPAAPPGDRTALWRLLGVIVALIGLVAGLHLALGIPLILGVVLGAPLFAMGWLAAQRGPAPRRLAAALGEALALEAALDGRTIAVLGAAALMGTLIGGLVPGDAVRAVLLDGPVPLALIPGAMMGVVLLLGAAGANPLLSVILLVGLFPDPTAVGLVPEALALALIGGWGLSTGISRAGAALIHTAQVIGSTPTALGLRGNLGFTLLAAGLVTGVTALMHALQL